MKRLLLLLGPGLLLGLVLIIRWALISWGFWHDGFLVPPGGDPAAHLELIKQFMAGTATSTYPPGFHLAIALLARVTDRSPLELITSIGPLLALLPILGIYVLAATWISPRAGLLSAALLGLSGVSPVIAYLDGNYPNLIGTFLVLVNFTVFGLVLRTSSWKHGLLCLGTLSLLIWFHHASLLLWLLVLVPTLVGFWLLRDPALIQGKRLLLRQLLPILLVIALFGVWKFSPMLIQFLQEAWGAIRDESSRLDPLMIPLKFHQYPEVIGNLIWQLGLLGLVFLALEPKLKPEQRLLLLIWFIVPFLVSRTGLAGAPARLSRELAIPLALSGGIMLSWLLDEVPRHVRTGAVLGIVFLLFLNTTMWTTGPAALPEGFQQWIWFHDDDRAKLAVLQRLPAGSVIAYAPSSPYYSALLADRSLVLPPAGTLGDEEGLARALATDGVDYLFVDTTILGNHDPVTYPYFVGYDEYRRALERFGGAQTVVSFSDGSVLRKLRPGGPVRGE